MKSKNPQVHAMARELAARRGTSVTEAIRHALRADLDRCRSAAPGQEEVARRDALLQLLSACSALPRPDQRTGADLQAELYDEAGLPS